MNSTTEGRRLLDKDAAAQYIGGISIDALERLISTGALPVVRLPAERGKSGRGRIGTMRRVLIDVRDLDALIERSKESIGDGRAAPALAVSRSRRA